MVTGNYFRPGHRIRLDVSSSNFPAYERNLNTGGNNFDETTWVTAINAIHHSKDHPSRIVLPIINCRGGARRLPSWCTRRPGSGCERIWTSQHGFHVLGRQPIVQDGTGGDPLYHPHA